MEEKLYSLPQASKETGVPLSTLRWWVVNDILPYVRIGRNYGVRIQDVEAAKAEPRKPGPKPK